MHHSISPSSTLHDLSCASPSQSWSSPQSFVSYKVQDSPHPQQPPPPAVPRSHYVVSPTSPYAQPLLPTPLAPYMLPVCLPHSTVPSSRTTPAPTSYSFSLHPTLKLNNVQFNIMAEHPNPQFHPALGGVDLRMHATLPPVPQIYIKIAELPFTFAVENVDGVRIQDVLQTVRQELLSGISYDELCYVPDQAQRAANQLSRLRNIQTSGRQGGVLRVDCLGSRINFVGLVRHSSTKDTWVAHFSPY